MNYLEQIRQQKPLVHNITNTVVANFSANGLLAIGASPAMANAPEEAAEMVSHADALVLNIGTCTKDQVNAMMKAGNAANRKGIPVVLDPVAMGATRFRTDAVNKILNEIDVTAIRGNMGEIAFLGEAKADVKGADTLVDQVDLEIVMDVAKRFSTIVIATGKTDIITDGKAYTFCNNGSSILPYVTGAGCLLTAVAGAFLSVADDAYHASIRAVCSYGVSAELAMGKSEGPGSFMPAFLDELYTIKDQTVREYAKLSEKSVKEEGVYDK